MGEVHWEINTLWHITTACDTIATKIARYSFNCACKTGLGTEIDDVQHFLSSNTCYNLKCCQIFYVTTHRGKPYIQNLR
jgi:hypothetical protein